MDLCCNNLFWGGTLDLKFLKFCEIDKLKANFYVFSFLYVITRKLLLDALQSKSFDQISSKTVTSLTAAVCSNKNTSTVFKGSLLKWFSRKQNEVSILYLKFIETFRMQFEISKILLISRKHDDVI